MPDAVAPGLAVAPVTGLLVPHVTGLPVAAPLGPDPVARDVLEAGDVVAHVKRYHVRELLGEGGMGRVYRAYDPVLDRDVALKVMKSGVPEGERRRFHREALHGAKFCHPGFVRVYDLGLSEEGRVEWFAMEHLPGRDLEQIVRHCRRKGTTIPLRLLADVFRQVLGALQYSHDCRVVHRDVKPANMFVTRDPNTRFVTTKLLDFGIALDERDDLAVETLVCGDPRYMAPEQTRLGTRVDARADLYATGMSLYEAITGHHPFEELLFGPAEDLLLAHRNVMPKPPSYHLRTDVPGAVACALDVVFAKACAKSPEDRFASARDMLRALWNVFE